MQKLDAAPALLKEKTEEEISFSTPPREQPNTKKWLWLLLIVFIAATCATVYYFLKKDNKEEKLADPVFVAPKIDTIPKTKDSIAKTTFVIPDSSAIANKPNDGYTFKIVIKEFLNKDIAQKEYNKLTSYGHKLLLYTQDSITYKIAMPFTSPVSDTLHAKDSLQLFFNTKTYVEKN